MTVVVNGEAVQVPDDATVATLMAEVGDRPGIAVAVGATVVRRAAWAETRLAEGDSVEVLHAVQGG
jgi:sulfur carrier protein